MTDREKVKLLFGPYRRPKLKPGDKAMCLYRDAEIVVTRWTAARTPWPRGYIAGTRGAGNGLLVNEELARAIQHESATAVGYWWGVCGKTVNKWRKALGVGRMDTEGSRRLIRAAAETATIARPVSGRAARRRGKLWTPEEVALLGTLPDADVARRTGRSLDAVAKKRTGLGRPAAGQA
jgi:hypothetical protein